MNFTRQFWAPLHMSLTAIAQRLVGVDAPAAPFEPLML
jgi:hypothetical protein